MRDRIERWLLPLALVLLGAALASDAHERLGLHPVTVVVPAVMLVTAWWVSPLRQGRHLDHTQAHARADDDDLIIYWKPGCSHCIALLARLDRAERDQAMWVNVWRDDDAAAFVADHNDGNVLTPTVLTGAGQRVPRDLDTIRSHLRTKEQPRRTSVSGAPSGSPRPGGPPRR